MSESELKWAISRNINLINWDFCKTMKKWTWTTRNGELQSNIARTIIIYPLISRLLVVWLAVIWHRVTAAVNREGGRQREVTQDHIRDLTSTAKSMRKTKHFSSFYFFSCVGRRVLEKRRNKRLRTCVLRTAAFCWCWRLVLVISAFLHLADATTFLDGSDSGRIQSA